MQIDRESPTSNIFRQFLEDKNDPKKRKVLLVISGSHIERREDQNEQLDSQSHPNYLKEMARSNHDCDFLVLNFDPAFAENLSDRVSGNVNIKFLKNRLDPTSSDLYTQIENNLEHFNKVIFCSHTYRSGAFDFHALHKCCEEKKIDCITIGAYENQSPCFISKNPLIKEGSIPSDLITSYFDKNLLKKSDLSKESKSAISSISSFLTLQFGTVEPEEGKQERFNAEQDKLLQEFLSINIEPPSCFISIEDENFKKTVANFVERKEINAQDSLLKLKKEEEENKELPSGIIGAGIGLGVGLICVSALGLGIVSVPAVAIVVGTAVIGATAFYLANHEIQKARSN